MVTGNKPLIPVPHEDDTVFWLRLTFENLKDIKPGSKLAAQVLTDLPTYESGWREAYINALERTVANPAIMVDEDTVIDHTVLDGEEGAYVLCWHFIPQAAVIPPKTDLVSNNVHKSLGRLRQAANNLEFDEKQFNPV